MKITRYWGRHVSILVLSGALLQAVGCTPVDFSAFVRDFAREALAAALF